MEQTRAERNIEALTAAVERLVGGGLAPPPTVRKGPPRLEVTAVRARHLPKMDTFGSIDPFCEVRLGGAVFTTAVRRNTYSPDWGEAFVFESYRVRDEPLCVTLFDWDLVGDNERVGAAEISAARLLAALEAGVGFESEEVLPVLCDGLPVVGKDREPAVITVLLRILPGARTVDPLPLVGSLPGIDFLQRHVSSNSPGSRCSGEGEGGSASASAFQQRIQMPGRGQAPGEVGASASPAPQIDSERTPCAKAAAEDEEGEARRQRFKQHLAMGTAGGSSRMLLSSLKTVLEEESDGNYGEHGSGDRSSIFGGSKEEAVRFATEPRCPAESCVLCAEVGPERKGGWSVRADDKTWTAASGARVQCGETVVPSAVLAAEVAVALEGVVRREVGLLSAEVLGSVGTTVVALRAEMAELREQLAQPVRLRDHQAYNNTR